jgi:hypothetical protein
MLDAGFWMLDKTRKDFIWYPVSSIQYPASKEKP